jgi:A/G-specific adenine glycosylase
MGAGKILYFSSILGSLWIPLPRERDRNDLNLNFSAACESGPYSGKASSMREYRVPSLLKLTPRQLTALRRHLLHWYRAHKRDLPWRQTRDPYRIWLSEIMLQQTRVAAVLPYYARFLGRFPDLQALARAPIEAVLKLWAGLGYYSRARNLHAAAKQILAKHHGKFPSDYDAALALPGIGRYTAAAILSIAYGAPFAALDGNVARVLARLGAIRGDLHAPQRWQALQETAQRLLTPKSAGDWNQAMMELGATICTPHSPNCEICPLHRWCRARALGIQDQLPAKRVKRATVRMEIAAAVLLDDAGRTLLVKNPGQHDRVLFSRLWQFPAVEVASDAAAEITRHLSKSHGIRVPSLQALPTAGHSVTFRKITLRPFLAHVDRLPKSPGTRTLALNHLAQAAVSSATRKISDAALRALGLPSSRASLGLRSSRAQRGITSHSTIS